MIEKCSFPGCIANSVNDGWCIPHGSIYGDKKPKEKKAYTIPKVSKKKKSQAITEKENKNRLTTFYSEMLGQAPTLCEECGQPLINSTFINPRTIIAHILPKNTFKSVDTNPDNIMYLCADCHNKFDLKGSNFIIKMNIYPQIVKRVKSISNILSAEELGKVPMHLLIEL